MFVGLHVVKGEGHCGEQIQFDIEYSYEVIDATDYYWRDSGYITSAGSELYVEPSKLYYFKNAVEGTNADKFGFPVMFRHKDLVLRILLLSVKY